jgi:hypothetical protein
MGYTTLDCPRCGASIPAGASGTIVCAYCSASLVETRDGFRITDAFADETLEEPELARFWLKGARYRIQGRIARGDSSDVLLARRDHRVGERVIAKVLRASADRDRLDGEAIALEALQRSNARGRAHFSRLLPQPVARGTARFGVRGAEGEAFVSLYRYESGFVHDFGAVRAAYPNGVPVTAVIWMYKRVLELLAFVHESGFVHGAVLPRHLLVHARDHGVRLCGFTCAARIGEPLAAKVAADAAFYPDAATTATPALDLVMCARSVAWLLGGEPPAEIARVMKAAADGAGPPNALDALAAIDSAARAALGPPRYVPFSMPGWG